jgi:hypothetical protein
MNYNGITATVLAYADRADDADLPRRIPTFMRIVEARINRALQTRYQAKRAYMTTRNDREYYALPADFAGLRSISMCEQVGVDYPRQVMEYVTPDYMNAVIRNGNTQSSPCYTIIENSIQVWPRTDAWILEILYYQRIEPLTADNPTNWASQSMPDVYIQGLMVEVCAYTKDSEASALWDARFRATLDEISAEDVIDRWSGTTPQIRIA